MLGPAVAIPIDPYSSQTCFLCANDIDLRMVTDMQRFLCANAGAIDGL